jgi:DNA polymerase-3 subunit epsilon
MIPIHIYFHPFVVEKNMREIVLDTETTGMDPFAGDRIVEIGCVELLNHIPTGNHYHIYINPERDVPAEVVAVHGLTEQFLKDKPIFAEIYADFLDFIGDAQLVIHNAEFDMKFINHHIQEMGAPPIPSSRIIDSLIMARQKFPGSPASLDALCKRFDIDNSNRTLHGAVLDSELLAEVYLELLGGRQTGLDLSSSQGGNAKTSDNGICSPLSKQRREPRIFSVPEEELNAHQNMIKSLGDKALWKQVN